jgi:hypothetical protein
MFIDQHPLCAKAWAKVCELPDDNPLRALYMDMPMSESEMLAAATNAYTDSRWRADKLASWANNARRRYNKILED